MKRNSNGILEFTNEQERIVYEAKKAAFLTKTDKENAAIIDAKMRGEYLKYVKDETR